MSDYGAHDRPEGAHVKNFEAARASLLTWSMMPGLMPDLIAVTIVSLISLVAKVSSIELARQTSGNLDREFRAQGIASLDPRHYT